MMKQITMRAMCLGLVVTVFLAISMARADVRVANVFGDNMVLQRDTMVPVWGWAEPGESVSVTTAGKSGSTRADAAGKWLVRLGPFKVGEPFTMTVKGNNSITFQNVVAGDVWVCSGQSNMEMALNGVNNAREERERATYPMIRHLKVRNTISLTPLDDVPNSGWTPCAPNRAGGFTAVGYFFGRRLHEDLKVPIGLLNTSWGGTIVETWTSEEALRAVPAMQPRMAELAAARARPDEIREAYDKEVAAWQQAFDKALNCEREQWQVKELDVSGWGTMKLPGTWEQQGHPNLDGIVWFRKTVAIPASWSGKNVTLSMSPIDDIDTTWVNGVRVGGMSEWTAPRRYVVPGAVVTGGSLALAVRVLDTGGGGGFHGDAKQMVLECAGETPIPIAGPWAYRLSDAMAAVPARPTPPPFMDGPNHPTLLYNAMIHPLLPYAIRGAIWYQGESNAGAAYQYRTLFPAMIRDWRKSWGMDLPFYFVQLANFMAPPNAPGESAWAELREAQSMTLALRDTGMAVIIDIGDAKDIHPKNKQDVGTRLALNALAQVHGKAVEYSGPVYKSMSVEGGAVRLRFDHLGGGLKAGGGGALKQFAIAGADKQFKWADARIDGETVLVSCADVPEPVAVRYAWADNPAGCNLYNQAGLPASPFRTDDWPGVTGGR